MSRLNLKDCDGDRISVSTMCGGLVVSIPSTHTYPIIELTKKQTEELIVFLIDNLDKLD